MARMACPECGEVITEGPCPHCGFARGERPKTDMELSEEALKPFLRLFMPLFWFVAILGSIFTLLLIYQIATT